MGENPVEPMTGIEPAYSAWEADVLPLNYIGVAADRACFTADQRAFRTLSDELSHSVSPAVIDQMACVEVGAIGGWFVHKFCAGKPFGMDSSRYVGQRHCGGVPNSPIALRHRNVIAAGDGSALLAEPVASTCAALRS